MCFFCLNTRLSSSTVQAHPIGLKKEGHFKLIKGQYEGIDFPVLFKQDSGMKFTDILETGYVDFLLISDRLKTILDKSHLTGWKTYSIKLYDKKGNEILGYHGFSVTGRCKSISFENSKIVEKQLVPAGPILKYYKGISIDQWDGTDFFSPEKEYQPFITNLAAEVLINNKITNLELVNLTDYEIDMRYIKRN